MDTEQTPIPNDAPAHPRRKTALLALTTAVLLGGAGYFAYWLLVLSKFESTDNAYVQGNVVQITPQVAGTVIAIGADETDYVTAGQTLVRLDPADAQVALDSAESELAQAVREVRTLFANDEALRAQVALHEADMSRARADLAKAQDDLTRRVPLLATGAVGREEYDHADAQVVAAKSALASAQSAVAAAKDQLAANQALTSNTTIESHPNVLRAAARVREAFLALGRVEVPAPVSGYLAKRSVQVGQRVQPGQSLMTVAELDQVWVDANFKENQLRNLRIGQPATLIADVYGNRAEYHGTVAGLGAGTGSAFALLPAQNASGNWIKIVQRVPVRIELDAQEVAAHPLRIGLSMAVDVDVHDTNGKVLADAPRSGAVAKTEAFDPRNREADDVVRRIVAMNADRTPHLDSGAALDVAGAK